MFLCCAPRVDDASENCDLCGATRLSPSRWPFCVPLTTLLNGALMWTKSCRLARLASDDSPVIEYVTSAPVVSFTAPPPVIEGVTPARARDARTWCHVHSACSSDRKRDTCTFCHLYNTSSCDRLRDTQSCDCVHFRQHWFREPAICYHSRGGLCLRVCFVRVHSCSSDLEGDGGSSANHPSRTRARDTWTCCRYWSACSSD